jgi:hypothetical protein
MGDFPGKWLGGNCSEPVGATQMGFPKHVTDLLSGFKYGSYQRSMKNRLFFKCCVLGQGL